MTLRTEHIRSVLHVLLPCAEALSTRTTSCCFRCSYPVLWIPVSLRTQNLFLRSMYCFHAGIGYTDDKLLQTRIFSYADTQRHRLGPNYLLLPVNAPRCPHHNNHHEGFMNFMHRDEEINYFPSRCAAQRTE